MVVKKRQEVSPPNRDARYWRLQEDMEEKRNSFATLSEIIHFYDIWTH